MKSLVLTLFAALFLNACGELSYKRGAGVADLENTKRTCQSKGSEIAIEKCLEDNGWTVQKLDKLDLFAEPSISDTSIKSDIQTTEEAANLNTENSDKNIVSKDKTAAANATTHSSNTSPNQLKNTTQTNPLDIYTVNSWWKTGVNADAFKSDSNLCVAKLGEAHKPDSKTQRVTAGFIICMKEKGWRAIKKLNQ